MDFLVSLFGQNGANWARVGIALILVLALILVAFWVFRALKGIGMGIGGLRGRLPRLAVLDYTDVDNRRRLVLIRRDNVEHLLLLGGPTDVVVETNIVRIAQPLAVPPGPLREADPLAPVDPAQVEQAARLTPRDIARLAAGEPALKAETPAAPEPQPAAPRSFLRSAPSFLAGRQPAAGEAAKNLVPPPPPRAPIAPPRTEAPALETPVAPPAVSPPPAPPVAEPVAHEAPAIAVPPPRPERPLMPPPGSFSQRLDAALKKPISPFAERKPLPPLTPPAPPAPSVQPPVLEEPAAPLTPPPAAPEAAAPAAPSLTPSEKSVFDSLEEEMASLLGRGPKGP